MATETAEGLIVKFGPAGKLRTSDNSYAPSNDDVLVTDDLIKKYKIRPADRIVGPVSGDYGKRRLADIVTVNGSSPDPSFQRPFFDKLTPTYPDKQIILEHDPKNLTTRMIDLISPIGRGQRCMVVAPPKAGKSTTIQDIAIAIQKNYPKIILIALLIDERPEEVTDMRSFVKGEVIASTFDEQPERHIEVAEVVTERAKRLAEMNGHVVILLDSITRLTRAYNTCTPAGGKTMSGGLDPRALPDAKKIFGAARNLREAGSITIIGTALVETGSKMDDMIFEEFKGTGNAEIHLDRRLMERRIFPTIDITKSGTRKEELLLDARTKERIWAVRGHLSKANPVDAMEIFKKHVSGHATNKDFIDGLIK